MFQNEWQKFWTLADLNIYQNTDAMYHFNKHNKITIITRTIKNLVEIIIVVIFYCEAKLTLLWNITENTGAK